MATQVVYPHIDSVGKEPCLTRLPRVRVAQIVMDYLAHGWSAEEMCRQHPYLTPAEIHAAMTYYFDHQSEMDEQIDEEWQALQSQRASTAISPALARLRAKGLD